MKNRTRAALAASLIATVAGCSSGPRIPDAALAGAPRISGHVGPVVDGDTTGTARFAGPLLDIFESNAALRAAERLDTVPRPPASVGYERAIDYLQSELGAAGFGASEAFGLRVLETPMAHPAWTPVSAELNVVGFTESGEVRARVTMLGFSDQSAMERTMLPEGVPSFDVVAPMAFSLEELDEGEILVTEQRVREVEQAATERGAAGIVSTFLFAYSRDPKGDAREQEAIFADSVRRGSTIPTLYASPVTRQRLRTAFESGAQLEMKGVVQSEVRPLRTVVAEIRGETRPEEVVYVITHADGYGANDNAAGAAGILELARSIKRLVATRVIDRPARTIRFVFGEESNTAEVALDALDGTPVCGIVADMIGQSYDETGAICLLERGWDPGAITPLPPDEHTPWGAGAVAREDIVPDGLSVFLREALVDVGERASGDGGAAWPTREHPWEGGSDHDTFLERRLPGALVWHFTDFTYATSLDRIAMVDPEELRRTSAAIGAAACAIADAGMRDLERHLDTLNLERRTRLEAVTAAEGDEELAADWRRWQIGARLWIRALCAGDPLPEPVGLDAIELQE